VTWRAAARAFAAYTVLAIVVTFPLVLHLAGALPHDLGDRLLSTAILSWNAHTLPFTDTGGTVSRFFLLPGWSARSWSVQRVDQPDAPRRRRTRSATRAQRDQFTVSRRLS
jgi:hypothetical protein